MILKYSVPNELYPQLNLKKNEIIHYFVPFDLQLGNNYEKDGYTLITNRRIFILNKNTISKEYPLEAFSKLDCESMIGCGCFIGTIDGEEILLSKFSMKHITRYSYIAKGTYKLSQQLKKDMGLPFTFTEELLNMTIESTEPELYCSNCNRALSAAKSCTKCDNKYRTILGILDICKPHMKSLFLLFFFMLCLSSLYLIMPYVQKNFIDEVIYNSNGTVKDIVEFLVVVFVLTAALLAADFLNYRQGMHLSSAISVHLRDKTYRKLQSLSLSFTNTHSPGDIMNRITEDTNNIRDFVQNTIGNMFTTILTMIGAIVLMVRIDPMLTLLTVMLTPLVGVFNIFFWDGTRRKVQKLWKRKDESSSLLQDIISGIRVVKSFGKEKYESNRFATLNKNYADSEVKLERFWAIFNPMNNFIIGSGLFFAIYYGGLNVLSDRLTAGELVQFITYTNILYGPIGWVVFLPRRLSQLFTSYERISEILEEPAEISDDEKAVAFDITGKVEFNHVHFGYKVYNSVLEDISFTAAPGEMIGLVGSSGAGKSTLINLIMRLYNVNEGSITIDGYNINNIALNCLHSQIGVVLQETFLFSGSILNNIKYAKPDATIEEVIKAAKVANAHDFISKMPDGYNTYVGEKGHKLSGGEKQRIAIARAILHNPKILILDEATSALDTESEYLIQQALDRLTKGRTTFAIAHRLSTLRNANRLIVLDGKQVAEIGTHNELLEKKGIYYKLVNAQLEMQKVENIETLYHMDLRDFSA